MKQILVNEELLQRVLDYTVNTNKSSQFWLIPGSNLNKIVSELRTALKQPEAEPVARQDFSHAGCPDECYGCKHEHECIHAVDDDAAPQAQQLQLLTDQEIAKCEDAAGLSFNAYHAKVRGQQIQPADGYEWHLARAIEQAVRQKAGIK